MKQVIAFETSDHRRFLDETEAREHERDLAINAALSSIIRGNPLYARLDTRLLISLIKEHGELISRVHRLPPPDTIEDRPFQDALSESLLHGINE